MRRLLLLATLFLGSAAPASAQWGETPAVDLGAGAVATCLRDAGGGRVASLATSGHRYGTALHSVTPDGLAPDGEALFGTGLQSCPAVAVADSGAAVVAGVVRTVVRRRVGPVRLLAATRDPGGTFGAPVELARLDDTLGAITPVAAVAADGGMAVAWLASRERRSPRPARRTLRIARRPPGAAFGPAETLVHRLDGGFSEVEPALSFDGAGGLTVAWARPRSDDGLFGTSAVEVATAAPGAGFVAPQRLVDDMQDVSAIGLDVAADGRAVLAHGGGGAVRVYERAPGAPAFTPGPSAASGATALSPSVAIASDGGAVVAWRPDADDAVDAIVRAPGGAFGPVQHLQRSREREFFGPWSLYATTGPPIDSNGQLVRVAAAPGGHAAVGWLADPRRFGVAVSGRIAVAGPAGFAPAAKVGGPMRDVDVIVPWLGTGAPAAVWADNSTTALTDALPTGRGRLHLSQQSRPATTPRAPRITLSAHPQALYQLQPLRVDARCAAACDLRASIAARGPRRRNGVLPGAAVATGGRDGAGRVRLRLRPDGRHIAPRAGGTVRVVVRATAPGGTDVSEAALRVRVRRHPIPPLARPLDVRARREGDDVILTWRTAEPARRTVFQAIPTRRRSDKPSLDDVSSYGFRRGGGHRRFRLRLHQAPFARWVRLRAVALDPPRRSARVVVPVE